MKAKSKRSVLLSSLAMLMVACVSLSTATYAWFTSTTRDTANGINVKTIKASNLVISKYNKDWKSVLDYGIANKVIRPASTANGMNWFKASAESRDNFAKESGTDFAAITEVNSYRFADEINVMNQGEAAVENVKISFTGLTDCARVAIVPADDRGNITGTFTDYVYAIDNTPYDAAASATTTETITPKTSCEINVGNLNPNEVKYYNIYVWFEGQDPDCTDAKASGSKIDDIQITVTGETEDQ